MDRHLSRENKNELMNQIMSPNKKMKIDSNFKQENMLTTSTPNTRVMSPAASNNINGFTMMSNSNTSGSLWGAFPMYTAQPQSTYQPVYPGMVPQYLPQNVTELHNVMKIGECSIKALGQQ